MGLTERQYEDLRGYEDGHARTTFVLPRLQLIDKGYLVYEPGPSGKGSRFYRITSQGLEALTAHRAKHGLPVGV